jgi:hypothetical protein
MADVAALTENYKTALQKLPDQREIPALFHSVALAGKDASVEFLLFEPKATVPKVLDKQPPENQKQRHYLNLRIKSKANRNLQTPPMLPDDARKLLCLHQSLFMKKSLWE